MFLHYLLNEDENSLVYKFLKVQDMNPSRNDWTVTVRKDLKFLNLSENFEETTEISTPSTCCVLYVVNTKIQRVNFSHV